MGVIVKIDDVLGVGGGTAVNRMGQCVLAGAVIADDGVEPHEGEVLGDVLVVSLGAGVRGDPFGLVLRVRLHDLGVLVGGVGEGAWRPGQAILTARVVAQVLGVSLPRHPCGIELVEQGGNILGVGAAILSGWSIRPGERHCLTVIVIASEFLAGVGTDN